MIRNSITPLSDEEMGYSTTMCASSSKFERQALAKRVHRAGSSDRKTGYVRRRMRKAADPAYEQLISELTLTGETYTLARPRFQGGYRQLYGDGPEMGDTSSSAWRAPTPRPCFSSLTP